VAPPAPLEEQLGVGAELLQPGLGGGPHPEEPAEAAREPAEQAVGGAHAHQLPPHADVVLLQVGEAHPHARHLELELPVRAPHRSIVVTRGHGAAARRAAGGAHGPHALRPRGGEEERRVVLLVDGVAEAQLLQVEHLHGHLHGEPLVLRRVAARVRAQALPVDRLAQAVPLCLLHVRVHLQHTDTLIN
jgi:hypothetical protein